MDSLLGQLTRIKAVDPHSLVVVLLGVFILLLFLAGWIANAALVAHFYIDRPDWKAMKATLRNRPWRFIHVALIAAGIFLIQLQISGINYLFPALADSQWASSTILKIALQVLSFQVAAVVILLILMRLGGISWRSGFATPQNSLGRSVLHGIVGYVATFTVFIVVAFVYKMALLMFGIDAESQPLIRKFLDPGTSSSLRFTIAFMAIVVAPFTEELMFRGVALPWLCKLIPAPAAIVVISVVFAAVHWNIASFVPLFVLSCGFSIAYLYSRNIAAPIVMHTAFNSLSIISLYLLKDKASLLGLFM
ncbi:MAG: hypothetical protein C0404_07650 [Verrucomicrobia bacterium]|nr:hypothetical protein [Verrucomicrobiota bacterium]